MYYEGLSQLAGSDYVATIIDYFLGYNGLLSIAALKGEENIKFEVLQSKCEEFAILQGNRYFDILLDGLKNNQSNIRRESAYILGELKNPEAINQLTELLKDENPEVVIEAYNSIIKLDSVQAAVLGIELLLHPNSDVAFVAYRYLINNIQHDILIEPMIELLNHQEARRKYWSLNFFLKGYSTNLKSKHLLYLLNYPDDEVVLGAIILLGKIGDKNAQKPIANLLNHWKKHTHICQSLNQLGWRPTTDKEWVYYYVAERKKEILLSNWQLTKRILLKDLKSSDELSYMFAAKALIQLGKEEIIPSLKNALYSSNSKDLANLYKNCGNGQLSKIAVQWRKNFYDMLSKKNNLNYDLVRNIEDVPSSKVIIVSNSIIWGRMNDYKYIFEHLKY
jgi:HEAT repeat protein